MISIKDTTETMLSSFDGDRFDLERWKAYIDKAAPGVKELCLEDLGECLDAGLSWENDYLPVLHQVLIDTEGRNCTIEEFHRAADGLDERINDVFGRTVDADLILYLGLCSGAGWAVSLERRSAVLLGVEKILELKWYDPDSMNALILHELGHIYQEQYGVLRRETDNSADEYLWQLFTEGIAMVFEQEVLGNPDFFHQSEDGWRDWCRENLRHIASSFREDLPAMMLSDQRYFGDWVRFEGRPDTGYYLGTVFVRHLLETESFDDVIAWDTDRVKAAFEEFYERLQA